jgi:hypothetical protein
MTTLMVGSLYVMVSGGKWILTCMSSNLVLSGGSFVVHSSSGNRAWMGD